MVSVGNIFGICFIIGFKNILGNGACRCGILFGLAEIFYQRYCGNRTGNNYNRADCQNNDFLLGHI